MKRSISMLLAVIMAISVFSVAIVPAGAAGSLLEVTATDYVNDQITYTVTLKNGVKNLTGAIVKVGFDSTVLEVVSGSAAGGNDSPVISGTYETGLSYNNPNEYSMAYINASATGYTTSADTALFKITFKAISEERPETTVTFKCVDFITEDEDDTNDINKADGAELALLNHTFKTLSTPVITAVDSLNSSLKVQWNSCTGADYYNVYRADNGDEVFATVTGTSFTDDTIIEGTEYTYYVTAENASGETEKSAAKSGMDFGAINNVSAEAMEDGIKVTWDALDKADNYDILRKLATEDDSKFEKIDNVATTYYIDTSAGSGVEYSYSIRAHHKEYTAGMVSDDYPVCVYIAIPYLFITNVSDGLQLSVTLVGGANSYEIKKSTNGGAFSVIKTLDSSNSHFIDTDVEGNKSYAYTVQAIADDSLKSAVSEQKVTTRLATPVLKSIENIDNGVRVSWSEVSADSYLTTYDVYRKTGNGAFAPIGSSNTLSYDDTTAVNGTVYTYTVVAKNDTGCGAYDGAGITIKRLGTPANIVSRTNANGIYVTWNAVTGADSYTVYRNGTEIGKSSTTRFEDKTAAQNTIYKYTIRANSGTSYFSAINATGAQGMNFGTVSSLKYTAIKNGITLTWNKLGNAEGYRVYRKTASDSSYTRIATVTSGTSYNDTQMSSGVVYYYVVEAYKGSIVADMSASTLSAKYLSVPVFTARNSGDDVKITITAVRGADSYVIERADGASTTYKSVATLTGGTLEYLDKNNIVAGEKYTYRVRAVSGNIKSFDAVVSMTKMKAPELTHYYNEIAGIQLKWTAVEDATQYYVYRKTPGSKSWGSPITVTQKTEYLDASVIGNTVYQYTVEAKTPDGLTGYDNIGKECRFLETPDLKAVANAVGGVKVTWNQVAGATSYRIYRRGAGTNNWLFLGEVDKSISTFVDYEGTAKSQIKSGNYYRYTVRAAYRGVDSNGSEYSKYSGFDKGGLYLKYIGSPKMVSVANSASGITIKWKGIVGNGSTWYRIYRRAAGQKGWTYLTQVRGTSYTDTKVKNNSGTTYRYTVRAMVSGKHLSGFESGLAIKRLTNPKLVSAIGSNAGITVKWGTVRGATAYYVYRKTSGTSWKKIATVKGGNKVSYLDRTARKGTTYTYTVRAYYGGKLSSYNTKGVSARR